MDGDLPRLTEKIHPTVQHGDEAVQVGQAYLFTTISRNFVLFMNGRILIHATGTWYMAEPPKPRVVVPV